MRIVSHTCSNTEIVCALGAGQWLVGVDTDSDYPPEVVAPLPKLGRDLELDVEAVTALKPDLVLTSLTVPGHERVVEALRAKRLPLLVSHPQSLDDVFQNILDIASALDRRAAGMRLVEQMQRAMPAVAAQRRPDILVEWWPKPVIVPGAQSWVTALLERAGGTNPWGRVPQSSLAVSTEDVARVQPQAIVMSWCGVRVENYREDLVRRRAGWGEIPAVRKGHIHAISEAFLGRPGPRLVEGYRALRAVIEAID